MKFLIITTFGQYYIEAEDFENAAQQCYNFHTGYRDVIAIIKIEVE